MVLPRFWELTHCHEVQKQIEPAILEATAEPGQVLVHFDPCSDAYCGQCDLSGCPMRSCAFAERDPWRVADLIGDPPFPQAQEDHTE